MRSGSAWSRPAIEATGAALSKWQTRAPQRFLHNSRAPPEDCAMASEAASLPDCARAALRGTPLEHLPIAGLIGEGKRSRVWRVRWQAGDGVLKLYRPEAAGKHLRRHGTALARYEYRRNLKLYSAPGLAAHVARPLAFVSNGPVQALVQEYVDGVLFETYRKTAAEPLLRALVASLTDIVGRAHAAGVYDLDLHPNNVLVTDGHGDGPQLKLYDFNKIPFHEHSPNPLAALLLRLGVIRPESRDLRRLHLFTDPPGHSRFGTRPQ
jgi:serine/threonine protein kinase